MRVNPRWLFCKNISEAKEAQREMAQRVIWEDAISQPIKHIAGMDVSNTPFDPAQMMFSAMVLLSYPSLEVLGTMAREKKQTFPYIPGLLGFREVPGLIEVFNQSSLLPEVIMVDGHGSSHPRELGVASHLGVLLDIPTIGVAKSVLVGKLAATLPEESGSSVPLVWKGKQIATVVRTKKRCLPLIISAGHRVSLKTATKLVLDCIKGYRLPEPTRQAHWVANCCRKDFFLKNETNDMNCEK